MPPTPDFHFLFIPPALGADWLFEAAQRYWQRFRPIVVGAPDLIAYAPAGKRAAITAVARRDLAPSLLADLRTRFPSIYLDPLVYDIPRDLRLTLDGRAALDQRFGVPEPALTATPRK